MFLAIVVAIVSSGIAALATIHARRMNKAMQALADAALSKNDSRGMFGGTAETLLEKAPFMAWLRGEDLEIKYCNAAYKTYVEHGATEISDRSAHIAERAMRSGAPVSQTIDVNLGHKLLSMQVTEIPCADYLVGYAIDNTDKHYWEKRCQDAERANYCFFESSSVAIAIYSAKRRLTFYNNSFATLWSLDPSWLDSGPHYEDVLEKLRRTLPEQVYFQKFKEQQLALFSAELKEPYDDFWHMPNGKAMRVVVMSYIRGGLLFLIQTIQSN